MELAGKTAIVTGASSGSARRPCGSFARQVCASPAARAASSGSTPTSRCRSTSPTGSEPGVRRRGGRGARRDRHPLQQRRPRPRPRPFGVDGGGRGDMSSTRTSTACCASPGSACRTSATGPHRLHGLDRGTQAYPTAPRTSPRSSPCEGSRTRCGRTCSAGRSGDDGRRRARRERVLARPLRRDRAKADAVYEGLDPVTPDEVAECVLFALTRPLHVNLDEIVIKALAQSSGARVVRREE